jgi:hypothetical protein
VGGAPIGLTLNEGQPKILHEIVLDVSTVIEVLEALAVILSIVLLFIIICDPTIAAVNTVPVPVTVVPL